MGVEFMGDKSKGAHWKEKFSNEVKLTFYANFKVANVGLAKKSEKPGFFSGPATKAKWNAWNDCSKKLNSLSEAERKAAAWRDYVAALDQACSKWRELMGL